MEWSSLDPWMLAVRLRRTVVRRVIRRALVVAVALVTGITVVSLLRAAEAARDQWGERRAVAVARHDLEPGDVVGPGSVSLRHLPAMAVAGAALTEVPDGMVVRSPIAAGEPLVGDRLGGEGLRGVAALVPEGHRAIAVPTGPNGPNGPTGTLVLQIGDRVDVLAALTGGDPADLPFPIVERAVVVDVSDQAVTVSVRASDVPLVAAGLSQGVIMLTLVGG